MIIDAMRLILLYQTLENFLEGITPDTKNEPTLVNCFQLQANTTLHQHALEKTMTGPPTTGWPGGGGPWSPTFFQIMPLWNLFNFLNSL